MRTTLRCALRIIPSVLLLSTGLGACGSLRPAGTLPPGTPIADARQSLGGPSGEYALLGGATRLEFRQGRETYLLDFDAGGRLASSRQVLTPQTFATIQPGMTQDDVLTRIGHPAFVFGIGWQQSTVWNYRFGGLDGDCVVFQVSISNATRMVTEAGPNTDPACDHASERS